MEMNDKAQMHTLEGFVAAILMVMTLILITKSSIIVTPQSELAIDVRLTQTAYDALAVLDMAPDSAIQFNLTEHVAGWNMTEATLQNNSQDLEELDTEIGKLLDTVMYNVDFVYVENGTIIRKHAILHGVPVDNSVQATRLVTLYNSTVVRSNGAWNLSSSDVKVVEVSLTIWHV